MLLILKAPRVRVVCFVVFTGSLLRRLKVSFGSEQVEGLKRERSLMEMRRNPCILWS